jgi:polyhydroxyalkanoate synthase
MAEQDTKQAPPHAATMDSPPLPSLEELQHWTSVMGRAQQLMLEHVADQMKEGVAAPSAMFDTSKAAVRWPGMEMWADPARVAQMQTELWTEGLNIWQRALGQAPAEQKSALQEKADKDKRFAAPEWAAHPMFDMMRQTYLLVSERMLGSVDALEGLDEKQRQKLKFQTQQFVDAMAPSNFAMTNPLVIAKTMETKGENLLKGLDHMLRDMRQGQMTQSDISAFEVGRNVAITPGKVVQRTPLYEIIQYEPAGASVLKTPLVIFPPWINRFYILDLNPKKSFIRWAVEQGLTVFMISWKSADETLVDIGFDDYLKAQIEILDTVRDMLGVESAHLIGYCVAGTYLAATLALLEARGEADKVASATFFTAQVDFSEAGDLSVFLGDEQMGMIQQLGAEKGYLDGRYMAATFNMLRGRDLVWNYVVNNYMLGNDYTPFDLLYWNADSTNLPSKWHGAYLQQMYRENKLVQPGGVTIDGTPINLSKVKTPTYVQAGKEDHIAPPRSVWKITHHFQGPLRFVLAGSGHIAGVVNPPEAEKYQYWINEAKVGSLDEFIAGAKETKGSWWPDWIRWIRDISDEEVPVEGARIPGEGKLPAIEAAPGSYVRAR